MAKGYFADRALEISTELNTLTIQGMNWCVVDYVTIEYHISDEDYMMLKIKFPDVDTQYTVTEYKADT